jgi:hypothetical protein
MVTAAASFFCARSGRWLCAARTEEGGEGIKVPPASMRGLGCSPNSSAAKAMP